VCERLTPARCDRLVSVGNVVVDVVAAVAALPERGGDVLAEHLAVTPGGGFNAMVAAARQGLPVLYAGALGTGPFGDLARHALAAAGIAVRLAARGDVDTGLVVALVDAGGERTFVTGPGAEATLTAHDLTDLRPTARDAVLVSGYGLVHPANRAALVPWVSGLPADVLVFLDPGPLAARHAPEALAAIRGRADWVVANAAEAMAITGHAEPGAAVTALAGRAGAVVRTGRDGCVIAVRGGPPTRVAGFAVTALDTNGAGDTHTGVFLAGLAAGADVGTAARRANAAAAVSVTRRGPATCPTAAELAAFLASHR